MSTSLRGLIFFSKSRMKLIEGRERHERAGTDSRAAARRSQVEEVDLDGSRIRVVDKGGEEDGEVVPEPKACPR